MSLYAAMVPEYTQQYQQSGERALQAGGALNDGEKYYATFRGTPVYETHEFEYVRAQPRARARSRTRSARSDPRAFP